MKQVFSTTEGVKVIEVPSPLLQPGHILVEVEYSLVSSGTELRTLSAMESKAASRATHITPDPTLIKKLVNYLRSHGVRKTISAVYDRLETKTSAAYRIVPIGYSCSGRVVAVGKGVTLFQPGDRVACAGANKATHSELVVVPENLVTMIPPQAEMKNAASVAVGAVAMQGVRRADVRLGESVAVIGLGLLGLISVQLLKLSGARVIGFDIDPTRAERAKELGIDEAYADPDEVQWAVNRFTKHMGVDVCLITAASQSDEIVQTAMEITRQKGRVVVVGLVPMNIQKNPFLRKEIDFLASISYGPGRYDERYEEKGLDYPYAYVRWTEKRNMEEYLRLLAEEKLDLALMTEEFPLDAAPEAYQRLKDGADRPCAIFIKYPDDKPLTQKKRTRVDLVQTRPKATGGIIRVAVAGAGRFTKRVHLPALKRLKGEVRLAAVMSRTGANALQVAQQYGADYATTSYDELLQDPELDAIIIGTRHNLHAEMALKALQAGKHVLVEKPLALTKAELLAVEAFYEPNDQDRPVPILLTGFNRRFAPFITQLRKKITPRQTPLLMNYQMNAGYLSTDHWLRTEEGGGRNLGEACHIYDLFTYLTDSEVVGIKTSHVKLTDNTHAKNENFTTTITFSDGSVGSLTYTSLGSKRYPKEVFHVYADATVHVLIDYKKLEAFGATIETVTSEEVNKGHFEELQAFVAAIKNGGEWPIPLWQQLQASRIALIVEQQIMGEVESDGP